MTNDMIARKLIDYARTLDPRTNLYRARSYRTAALTIQRQDLPLADLLTTQGRAGLARLPGIGPHLAFTLETLLRTGVVVPWGERAARSRVA